MTKIIEVEETIKAIKSEELSEKEKSVVKRYMQARGMLDGVPKILIGAGEYTELSVKVWIIKDNDGGKGKTPEEWLEIQKKTMS